VISFPGLRYDTVTHDLSDLICPPYDVITPQQRDELARVEYNAVHLEVPDPTRGTDKYEYAAKLLRRWQEGGELVKDAPSLYVYRMSFIDERGELHQTKGVLCVISVHDESRLLPHEQTTRKDVTDRLSLIRATRTNMSPIWALCSTPNFTGLLQTENLEVIGNATTPDGVHHQLWRISQQGFIDEIAQAIANNPLLIADGHHRTEVARTYATEIGVKPNHPAWGILAFVTELAPEQLHVEATHRVVTHMPLTDLIERATGLGTVDRFADATSALDALDASPSLILTDGSEFYGWTTSESLETRIAQPIDTLRCNELLKGVDGVQFQHGIGETLASANDTTSAILLHPVTVEQIAAVAKTGKQMPPKTTYFSPKPQTGMVFREIGLV
jgi:uncharacterized protein (DUF1015 family)